MLESDIEIKIDRVSEDNGMIEVRLSEGGIINFNIIYNIDIRD